MAVPATGVEAPSTPGTGAAPPIRGMGDVPPNFRGVICDNRTTGDAEEKPQPSG